MQEIIIDEELKALLPPLDRKTYESLEENIIANGCMFPLVTWNPSRQEASAPQGEAGAPQGEALLIDGHNRYAICMEHGIPFETVEKEFGSREDVIIWIIGNQVARRNLTPMQLTYFRGLHYNTVKLKRGNSMDRKRNAAQMSNNDTFEQESATANRLAKEYKVSRNTIFTDAKASAAIDAIGNASPAAKAMVLSGDVPVDKKVLRELASASEKEIAEVAARIEGGSYEKEKPEPPDAGAKDPGGHEEPSAGSAGAPGAPAHPENTVLGSITGAPYQALLSACRGNSAANTKKALRAFIDMLEELYRGL